jgi:hypothetical protein
VAHPSEPVRLHQSNRDQPPDLRQQRRNQQGKGNAGAHEMQPAGYAVGVFAEIKRVEVGEGSEAGFGGYRNGLFGIQSLATVRLLPARTQL